jgi:hypothetical protein
LTADIGSERGFGQSPGLPHWIPLSLAAQSVELAAKLRGPGADWPTLALTSLARE